MSKFTSCVAGVLLGIVLGTATPYPASANADVGFELLEFQPDSAMTELKPSSGLRVAGAQPGLLYAPPAEGFST